MQIGNTIITTPEDHPTQFDPAWRSAVAAALADNPTAVIPADYMQYKRDEWIKEHKAYLIATRTPNKVLSKDQKALRLASRFYQGNRSSDVRFKLEPLLLTAVPINIIALDIGGGQVDPLVFEAYERLYFNIRLDNGNLHPSFYIREYFAMPQGQPNPETTDEVLWRVIAAHMGYEVLVSTWLWTKAHGLSKLSPNVLMQSLWTAAQATQFLELFGKRVSHFNLAALQKSWTDQERMLREAGTAGVEQNGQSQLLLKFLNLCAPEILQVAHDVDADSVRTSAIQSRLLAQRNVTGQAVVDHGADIGIDGLTKLIEGQFRSSKQMEQ
jgi:hypothetical protein